MQQCATLGSARLSLVWNDSACPTTARELPQRTPAIVPQRESERSGIDGRRLLLSALSASLVGCSERHELPAREGTRARRALSRLQGRRVQVVIDARLARRTGVHGCMHCVTCTDLTAVLAGGTRGSCGGGSGSLLSTSGSAGASRTLPIDVALLIVVQQERPV
jgi:hypothetical protein